MEEALKFVYDEETDQVVITAIRSDTMYEVYDIDIPDEPATPIIYDIEVDE